MRSCDYHAIDKPAAKHFLRFRKILYVASELFFEIFELFGVYIAYRGERCVFNQPRMQRTRVLRAHITHANYAESYFFHIPLFSSL